MRLCERCVNELQRAITDSGLKPFPKPSNAYYGPESQCDFWAHKELRNWRQDFADVDSSRSTDGSAIDRLIDYFQYDRKDLMRKVPKSKERDHLAEYIDKVLWKLNTELTNKEVPR
jgi:hypothetical protein